MGLPDKLPNWAFWVLFSLSLLVTGVIWILSFLPLIRKRRKK